MQEEARGETRREGTATNGRTLETVTSEESDATNEASSSEEGGASRRSTGITMTTTPMPTLGSRPRRLMAR
jgi:hypothetical protein